jgi:hypothetical protein
LIDVVRDTEGLRMAFAEILEQDFDRARISRSAESASESTRERLLASVTPLMLSPGYHQFAYHLMQLEAQQKVGVAFNPLQVAAYEAAGLLCLSQARASFEGKHPPCGACGARQDNRFSPECHGCGAKFTRRKK